MLDKINVSLGLRSYPIYFTESYSHLERALKNFTLGSKVLIVTDSNLEKFQLPIFLQETIDFKVEKIVHILPAGEASKNLEIVNNIYKGLLDNNFDRNSTIIALGGGVVGDIAGFVAATFYRGINFIQIPTTLLSQTDSSVGGKVGVDYGGYKNVIGSFYQPKIVYINVKSLQTLPKREIIAGLCEVVKHAIIKSPELFDYIEANADKIFALDSNVLKYLIKENCKIKSKIVQEDEREEKGIRELLNFGHTIGHAIESSFNFTLLHGECVSIGMIAAFKIAYYLEMVSKNQLNKVEKLFKKLGFLTSYKNISPETIYEKLFFDKKAKNGKLYFVLPRSIGEVLYLKLENLDIVKKVISELREK
jgi:3-dehydroquinate synthase